MIQFLTCVVIYFPVSTDFKQLHIVCDCIDPEKLVLPFRLYVKTSHNDIQLEVYPAAKWVPSIHKAAPELVCYMPSLEYPSGD